MNKAWVKKRISLLLILAGAVLLIVEIASSDKNYYMQSIGIICLMTGVFLVNTNVASKSAEIDVDYQFNNDEEE